MGDKTQLLAIVLAAMFRRPWPIVAGILVATLGNHAMAGAVGGWVAQALGPELLRWVIGLSFLAMAGWMLIPDRIDEDATGGRQRFGVFGTTVVAFVLVGVVQVRLVLNRAHQETKGWLRQAARVKGDEAEAEHLAKRDEPIEFLRGCICWQYQVALVGEEHMGASLAEADQEACGVDLDLRRNDACRSLDHVA